MQDEIDKLAEEFLFKHMVKIPVGKLTFKRGFRQGYLVGHAAALKWVMEEAEKAMGPSIHIPDKKIPTVWWLPDLENLCAAKEKV